VNGDLCPYREHEPQTEVGRQAWDVLTRCVHQFEFVPAGDKFVATRLILPAALSLADALGYDERVVAILDTCEAGALAGLRAH